MFLQLSNQQHQSIEGNLKHSRQQWKTNHQQDLNLSWLTKLLYPLCQIHTS